VGPRGADGTQHLEFEGPDGETVRWERRPLTVEGEWETEDASGKTLAIKVTQHGASAEVLMPGRLPAVAEVTPTGLKVGEDSAELTAEGTLAWPSGEVWRPAPEKPREKPRKAEMSERVREKHGIFDVAPDVNPEEFKKGAGITMQGDWMLFMVHRVYQNDPEITELSFENMHMPDSRLEPRVAPKLMEALHFNTHLRKLNLNNANLQAPEGVTLGSALRENTALRTLLLESSFLDAHGLAEIANGVASNRALETLKLNGLKNFSGGPGALVEESFAKALEANTTLIKLGIELQNPHWRDTIDRKMMQNADRARRVRKSLRETA
jgi:hypothetical protein